ncbi:MAG: hypothetical protein UEC12_02350, partial [Lachnospiraceae bacterium]|nr:hypothetical protein [Lachnospiraceae bacterium]
ILPGPSAIEKAQAAAVLRQKWGKIINGRKRGLWKRKSRLYAIKNLKLQPGYVIFFTKQRRLQRITGGIIR